MKLVKQAAQFSFILLTIFHISRLQVEKFGLWHLQQQVADLYM
jgi:hypothetical protein